MNEKAFLIFEQWSDSSYLLITAFENYDQLNELVSEVIEDEYNEKIGWMYFRLHPFHNERTMVKLMETHLHWYLDSYIKSVPWADEVEPITEKEVLGARLAGKTIADIINDLKHKKSMRIFKEYE
jgi:hypothetical protein